MTGVRKHFCMGDCNIKTGKSEWVDWMFGIEYSLLYMMQDSEIVINNHECSECGFNDVSTEKDQKNGMTLTGCS